MTINLFQTPEYRTLIQSHIFGTIKYLFFEFHSTFIMLKDPTDQPTTQP